jgi:predicted alpha-1,6-mannanase (GH76 family)
LGIAAGRAHAAFAAFLTRYWDPRRHTFVRATGTDLRTARPADFWWQAQAWEAVLDAFEDGDELATRSLVRQVFDARVRAGFAPDFNDDLSWWAMASVRAYALTADPTYLRQARSIAATVWRSWDRSSGGIWWRRSRHDQKNVATNATAAIVEARLARLTGDPRDRAHAVAIFGWLEAHLRRGTVVLDRELANGHVVDEPLTYDYGEYLGAAREMADLTGDVADLGLAEDLADAGMALAVGGVLPDEGTGDGGGFKGIFVGQLALLAHQTGSDRYRSFLEANADAAWAHRRGDGLSGSSWWHAPGSGPVQVLTASSGVRLFEQVAILEREAPSPRALAGAAHTWPSGPGWLIGSSLGD